MGHFPGIVEFADKTSGQLIYGKKLTQASPENLLKQTRQWKNTKT
jgi:hypothetical protein